MLIKAAQRLLILAAVPVTTTGPEPVKARMAFGGGVGRGASPDWTGALWNAALRHQLPDAGANLVKDCGSAVASAGHALPPPPAPPAGSSGVFPRFAVINDVWPSSSSSLLAETAG